MARIKAVLNERRRAYDGAFQLAASERAEAIDQQLLEHRQNRYFEERKVLEEKAKTLGRRRPGRAKNVQVDEPELQSSAEATTSDAHIKKSSTSSSAADLATAGMFGMESKRNGRRQ